ncbi:MAG: antibiotic biosynthesis monooxygenase [Victivallales bacterium]|nr:antibiotic biosynthesis monooxygenase [Victivallales bacterium]MCF7889250.1 antibiotic biosynthesis monooxygenase [Victivallales bacterium]
MITTIVYIEVKPDCVNDFIEATVKNHQASVKEAGNMRFDFLQSNSNPCSFVLYEAYETEEEAAKHKETAHYLEWREKVAPFMAEQRLGVRYKAIKPENSLKLNYEQL